MKIYYTLLLLITFLTFACNTKKGERKVLVDSSLSKIDSLKVFDDTLSKEQYISLLEYNNGKNQDFKEYINQGKHQTTIKNKVILIQPIGTFSDFDKQVIDSIAQYLNHFFQIEIKIAPCINDSLVVPFNARKHIGGSDPQIDANYVINKMKNPKVLTNVLLTLYITSEDLFTGNYYYVFGLGSSKNKSCVASILRMYHVDNKVNTYLLRMVKLATHEICHVLYFDHCVNAQCLMNSTSTLSDFDSKPNHLCSDCLKKLNWNLKFDNKNRTKKLLQFFESHNEKPEFEYYTKVYDYFNK